MMSWPTARRDALEVDAAVLVEALVLDRDHGLLHHRRDVAPTRRGSGPRCWSASRASSPLVVVDHRVLACSNWARSSSCGRSWATAIMIPKTQETKASTASPRKTSAKRSFRSSRPARAGLGARGAEVWRGLASGDRRGRRSAVRSKAAAVAVDAHRLGRPSLSTEPGQRLIGWATVSVGR